MDYVTILGFLIKMILKKKEIFNKENIDQEISPIITKKNKKEDPPKKPKKIQQSLKFTEIDIPKSDDLKKSTPKSSLGFTLGKLLSYIIVSIISFIAIIIVIDTFKTPIYKKFPNIEILLFNFFETLLDIQLFIKDLI